MTFNFPLDEGKKCRHTWCVFLGFLGGLHDLVHTAVQFWVDVDASWIFAVMDEYYATEQPLWTFC